MVKKVIVNQHFASHDIMHHLKLTNTCTSNTILPDLIFPECNPSLAFVYLEEAKLTAATRDRLDKVNQQFRNVLVIYVGTIDPLEWCRLQFTVDNYSGSVRYLCADEHRSAAKLTFDVLAVMKKQEKLKLQELYFQNERSQLSSPAVARKIIREAFGALDIPVADTQIIEDGLSTLSNIITASREALIENSPASYDTIVKITSMFDS